ncbi:MAG: hypothetical protein QMD22_06050 [archaeon]|nr:hypothetical protein [archaeon]
MPERICDACGQKKGCVIREVMHTQRDASVFKPRSCDFNCRIFRLLMEE